MLKEYKVAVARIFVDLIKADSVVDAREMDCWRNICRKYSIDREVKIKAAGISFADALNLLCRSGVNGLKDDLLGDCRAMTVSDGFCSHSEALLMMALTALLSADCPFEGKVISIPRSDFNIDMASALYIESYHDSAVNDAVRHNYRLLFKELQLAGFHFVYIPRIIDHYRDSDPDLFREILSFLAPQLGNGALHQAQKSILEMTTAVFCKDLLCNKCGITDLRNTFPSLLIKLGDSSVGGIPYANYLQLDVDRDIVSTVRDFVDCFMKMQRSDTVVVKTLEESDNQFQFHGFYKQLLNIFLKRHDIRSSILLDPCKEEIRFPEIDTMASGLHRRERALYAMMLCQGSEGIDFSMPDSAEEMSRFRQRMLRLQRKYAAVYGMFGGDRKRAPDLSIPEIRRPVLSCLKRALKNITGLYNPEDYNLTRNPDGSLAVHIEPECVFVVQHDSYTPIPLMESHLYRAWQEA